MSALLHNFASFWYLYAPVAVAAAALLGSALPGLVRHRGKVMAIAVHSFREAVRRKTLFVAFGAALIILVSTPFVHALGEPGAKLKMVQLVCVIALNIFGCMVAIVLGAFSLPDDIADKTIYSVLTKPVPRDCVVVGRILGISAVTLLSFALVAAASFVAVQLAARRETQRDVVAKLMSGRRFIEPHQMEGFGEHFYRRPGGVIWAPAQQAGVRWLFDGLDAQPLRAANVPASIYAMINSSDPKSEVAPVTISVSNPATGDSFDIDHFALQDMALQAFKFPTSLVSADGELEVSITGEHVGDWVAVRPNSLRLEAQPSGFVGNFLRAMAMLAMQFVLIVAVSVAGSTLLSARVSVLVAIFVVFCGYTNDFIQDLAKAAFVVIPPPPIHDPSQFKPPTFFVTFCNNAVGEFLRLFSAAAPDFRRFAVGQHLVDGLYVSPRMVCEAFGYMAIYALLALAFARAVMSCRELD